MALKSFAQSPVLKNFTIKDGLPSNETYSIYQDTKGFIWVCTDAGLVKYDANTFRTFNSTDGLPDNTVFEVKEDKKGRIWYRTFSGNIGYVLNDSIHVIEANAGIIEFQKGGIICSFYIDNEFNLYVGRQTPDLLSFLKIKPPYTTKNISTIYSNSNKNAWIDIVLFPDGEFVYSERRTDFKQKYQAINFYDNKHHCLLKDSARYEDATSSLTRMSRKGSRFVLGNDRLLIDYQFSNKTVQKKLQSEQIINVYISKSNKLIVSYRDKGIMEYNADSGDNSMPEILTHLSNSSIIEDNNNGIWYCTLKNGLFYTNNLSYKMFDVSNNTFKSVFFLKPMSGNKLNIGIEGDGCYLYETSKGRIKFLTDMNKGTSGVVKSLTDLNSKAAFLSFRDYNYLFDYDLKKASLVKGTEIDKYTFTDIYKYKSDFLGYSYTRAIIFDAATFSIKQQIKTKDRFTSFASNPTNGEAYFGALHGLYKYYGQSELLDKDRVNDFRVKDIDFINNRLYVATKGFGLVIRSGSLLDTIDVANGLLSNVCEKIVVDGNRCWVSSNLGLSCITYYGYGHFDLVNYPLKDFGTPSLIQDYFIQDSILYFASGSMVYTYPLVERNENGIPFYVYKLEVNNEQIQGKKNIELKHDQATIKIHFGALYYNFRGTVKYRYKLVPNDEDWTYTNENSILFPSLSPGSYSLLLQAQKNNGSWIECLETVSFTIQKPFWLSWWFITMALLAGFAIVSYVTFFVYRKKVERVLLRSKIKTRLYNLEIKAMKAQMNPHFIFNSLNSIQQFILANENENAYKYLSKFSKLVRKLLESNENESLSVENEVEILTKYLEIESLRFKDSFSYQINIDPALVLQKRIPHMMIQPFVENAIWHGLLSKQGERVLKLSFNLVSNDCIECIIDDNGIGINKSKERPKSEFKDKSLALEFIRERLQLFSTTMGTSYSVKIEDKSDGDSTGTGTRVRITLPFIDSNT